MGSMPLASLLLVSRLRSSLLVALFAALDAAPAQNNFVSVEPNNTKFEATPALDFQSGDSLSVPLTLGYDSNIFRLRHAPAPLGIYRHELRPQYTLASRIFEVLGRDAVTEFVYPQSLAVVQEAGDVGTPHRFLAWYGFGKSDELYVDLAVSGAPRIPSFASARLTTSPVTEVDVGVVAAALTTVRALPVGAPRDLELHAFDAEFNAIPGALIAESWGYPYGATTQLSLAPGVYHFAVADHGTTSHLPPTYYDIRAQTAVLDYAGPFLCGSPDAGFDVELTLQGNGVLTSANATKLLPFEVLWFRVQVDTGQSTSSFCPGDGTAGACGCLGASPVNSGMGCLNSTARGATAIASDLQPWIGGGSLDLFFEDLPPSTLLLAFLSPQAGVGTPVSAGLFCLGPGASRVGPFSADLAGTVRARGLTPSQAGFLVGQTVFVQGAYRDPVAGVGCVVNFTSGASFILR